MALSIRTMVPGPARESQPFPSAPHIAGVRSRRDDVGSEKVPATIGDEVAVVTPVAELTANDNGPAALLVLPP